MSHPRHTNDPSIPAAELARLGSAAMPDVTHVATHHMDLITAELAIRSMQEPPLRATRPAPRPRARRLAIGLVAASLLVVPSLAVAGVLPDPVQRAAVQVAGVVGVDVPDPDAAEQRADAQRASQAGRDRAAAERAERADARTESPPGAAADGTGRGLGGEQRDDVPGAPAEGEVRGNRFGQVAEGPDRGTAQPPATEPRVAKPRPEPAPRSPARAAPATPVAPDPTPEAVTPPVPAPVAPATSNRGGNGGGKPHEG